MDDLPNDPLVPVPLIPLDLDLFAGDQLQQVGLGLTPEGLSGFRRIDTGQPDFVELPVSIEDMDGVSVRDLDHLAGEGGGGEGGGEKQGKKKNGGEVAPKSRQE